MKTHFCNPSNQNSVFCVCGEQNTRAALGHLESIAEKNCLLDDFKDLEVSLNKNIRVSVAFLCLTELWDPFLKH